MILFDSNLWLALALSKHTHHAAATQRFEAIDDVGHVLFCRATQQTFLRLLTNAVVLRPYGRPPLTNQEAWDVYHALLADDRVGFQVEEPAGLESHWMRFAVRKSASPKLWMDAYLAAFACAAGHRLATTDAAFRQFTGLELELIQS